MNDEMTVEYGAARALRELLEECGVEELFAGLNKVLAEAPEDQHDAVVRGVGQLHYDIQDRLDRKIEPSAPSLQEYRQMAFAQYHRDGEVEIDKDVKCPVSRSPAFGNDNKEYGAYVSSWVWVDNPNYVDDADEAEEEPLPAPLPADPSPSIRHYYPYGSEHTAKILAQCLHVSDEQMRGALAIAKGLDSDTAARVLSGAYDAGTGFDFTRLRTLIEDHVIRTQIDKENP